MGGLKKKSASWTFCCYIIKGYRRDVLPGGLGSAGRLTIVRDPMIVTAIFDRLLHHSAVINIRGNSYRLKGKIGKRTLESTKPTE